MALAIAPLLAIFHQASVRHAVCEHGDLIEPDLRAAHDGDSLGDDRVAEGARDAVASIQSDTAPAVHGHNHCSVGTLAKSAARVVAPAAAFAALPERLVDAPTHRDIACARLVLACAPKTSPPIVRASVLS